MSVAHRLGRVLEKVTRQSGRLPAPPEYGSWLLGKASESQLRRRVRIQQTVVNPLLLAQRAHMVNTEPYNVHSLTSLRVARTAA